MTKRLALIPAAALAISVTLAGPAHAQDLYDCGDFATQEEAQAVFDQDTSDPYGLDGPIGEETDGVPNLACESLPSGGGAGDDTAGGEDRDDADDDGQQVSETPTGGVDAGGGDGDNDQVLVYAGLGILVAAGGAFALRRRVTE